MKKVNLGVALTLVSGIPTVHAAQMQLSEVANQPIEQSKILVKPNIQIHDLILAQGSGGNGGNAGNGGNSGKGGNAGKGGDGGNAGSVSSGKAGNKK
jgi:hypothetical protein